MPQVISRSSNEHVVNTTCEEFIFSSVDSPSLASATLCRMTNRNVLGGPLVTCGCDPMTGFFRDGMCRTCEEDRGVHTVCARVTADFLVFSKANGNDLSTPLAQFGFPGLRPGDRWCLCAGRWKEALDAGMAPPVVLEATHESTLEVVSLEELRLHAIPHTPVANA